MKAQIKRAGAILIILCLGISSVCFSVNADEASAVSAAPESVAAYNEVPKAYRVLDSLGIFDSLVIGTENIDDCVTRGDLVKLLLRMVGMTDDVVQAAKERSYFTDVTITESDAGYINTAYEYGIVSGDELGRFLPQDAVTYHEACKMFAVVLGYKQAAESTGGWPYGYIKQCSRLGILSGVNASESEMTYRNVFEMLYNSLEVPYINMGTGADSTYIISEASVLETFYDADFGTAIVEGNQYTNIYGGIGENALERGELVIGGEIYKTYENELEMLGMRVDYYYKTDKNTGEKIILAMFPANNKTIRIDSDSLYAFDRASGRYSYYSEKNGKLRSLSLADGYSLIYNNRLAVSPQDKHYIPGEGYILFIDNDSDGSYDIVSVYDYQNKIVKNVNAATETITFETERNAAYMDLSNSDYAVYDVSRAEAELGDIKKGDAVAILESASGEKQLCFLYILDAPKEGTVSEVREDKIILADGTILELDGNSDNHYHIKDINAGAAGKFATDLMGRVFAYIKTSLVAGREPCLLIQAARGDALSGKITLRVLRFNGKVEAVQTADKFTIRYPDPSNEAQRLEKTIRNSQNLLAEAFSRYSSDNYVIRELALVSFNSKNEISSIELPTSANYLVYGNDGVQTEPDFSGDGLHAYNNEFQNFHYYLGHWLRYTEYNHEYTMSEAFMGSQTQYYFSIPAVHDSSRVEKDYKLITSFKKDTDYDMRLYGLTSDSTTVDIGIYRGSVADEPTSDYYAVEEISNAIVDDAETVQLDVYNGTTLQSFYLDPSDKSVNIPSDLGVGDLVRLGTDSDGKIVSLYRYVKFDEEQNKPVRGEKLAFTVIDRDGLGGDYHYRFGIAYKSANDSGVYFCSDEQIDDYNKIVDICQMDKFTNVMVFNRRTKSWSPGTYNDILCYSDVGDKAGYISYKTLYNDQERVMYIYDMQ